MEELRCTIPWYEWKYRVSNLWRVKSKSVILKTERNKMWYHRIKLYGFGWKFDKKTYQIHRLVYCSFNKLPIHFDWNNLVCHKDNNIENNKLDNLYTGTQIDNMRQASNDWRVVVPQLKWQLNANSKLTDSNVVIIKKLLDKWVQQKIIAEAFGISKSTINAIYKLRLWNHVSR